MATLGFCCCRLFLLCVLIIPGSNWASKTISLTLMMSKKICPSYCENISFLSFQILLHIVFSCEPLLVHSKNSRCKKQVATPEVFLDNLYPEPVSQSSSNPNRAAAGRGSKASPKKTTKNVPPIGNKLMSVDLDIDPVMSVLWKTVSMVTPKVKGACCASYPFIVMSDAGCSCF